MTDKVGATRQAASKPLETLVVRWYPNREVNPDDCHGRASCWPNEEKNERD